MSTNRPIIGNGREAQIKSFSGYGDAQFGAQYPGLGSNAYSDFAQGGGFPAPYEGGVPAGGGGGSSSSNLLGGINFNQIKGFVDRMGGIEGIVGTMAKMQKLMATLQQMAPMFKLIMSGIGSKAKTNELDYDELLYRRKRRRKRGSNAYRKNGRGQSVRRRR